LHSGGGVSTRKHKGGGRSFAGTDWRKGVGCGVNGQGAGKIHHISN